MKRILFICLLCFLISSGKINAQEKAFTFGFKVSPNLGWIKSGTKEFNKQGISPGISWGFIAEFHLLDNYAINTGFNVVYLYNKMSFPYQMKVNTVETTGHLTRKFKLKYLEIPLTLKMKTNELGKFRLYGLIGLGTSFLIGAKADDEFKYNGGIYSDEKVDVYDDIVFLRESLIVGAGTEILLGESTIIIVGIQFNNGFLNFMSESKRYYLNNEPKAINNFAELTIGILF
jgi:hypothetical protein